MLRPPNMVQIGRYNLLRVMEQTKSGFILGEEPDTVFLPNAEATAHVVEGRDVRVFVYQGSSPVLQGTLRTPKAVVGEFAVMRCIEVNEYGAFLDWGIPKDLFVPFGLQHLRMVAERNYVVHVTWDKRGERIIGSSKLAPYFDYDTADLAVGDAVDLLVFAVSDLGAQVVIDQRYAGMIHADATSRRMRVGEELSGYVAAIRQDNRVDVTLTMPGAHAANRDVIQEGILLALEAAGGFLPLHDRSTPAEIHAALGLSKKVFKRSVGGLYKARKIRIGEDGIHLLES